MHIKNCSLLFGLLGLCLLLSTCTSAPPALDLQQLETEIHALTNRFREEQALPPLAELPELKRVSRIHSQDMAERQFFEHINPDGKTPTDRLEEGFPEAVNRFSGENLAQHSQDHFNTEELAAELLRLWIASPEHHAQLIAPEYSHLGVGVVQDPAGVVYATQTFATVVAQLTTPLPTVLTSGTPFHLGFTFKGGLDPGELSAFLETSDGFARIEGPDGVFYQGKGPVPILWEDNTRFHIKIPTELGPGQYSVRLGQGSRFFERRYTLTVQ